MLHLELAVESCSSDGKPQDVECQRMFFDKLETSVIQLRASGYVALINMGTSEGGAKVSLVEDGDLKTQLLNGHRFTKHEMDSLKCILLTRDRRSLTNSMLSAIKDLKPDTEYAEELGFVDPMVTQVSQYLYKANATAQKMGPKFDNMFALTYAITKHTHWMIDKDFDSFDSKLLIRFLVQFKLTNSYLYNYYFAADELNPFIRQLGSAWSAVLGYSDKALGIDADFTRPGVEALLNELRARFAALPYKQLRTFEWDAYKQKVINRGGAGQHKKRKAEGEAW